ncbi:MAG: LCP family protein [Clostridia bacterium]|nr:LCP family protein [Clostridia bacterium]
MSRNFPKEDSETYASAGRPGQDDDIAQYYPDGDYENMVGDDEKYEALLKKKQKNRRKRGRMTRSQRALIFGIFVVYAVVLCIAAWMIFYRPATPGFENDIPFDTNPVSQETTDSSGNPGSPDSSGEQGNGYTVQDGKYNILVVGHDRAASLADVIMLVNCDTENGDVTVMQLPRDTCVRNFVSNKINAAYSAYYNAALKEARESSKKQDPYLLAVDDLATLLEQSLCIQIHHTAVLNLDGLVNIVNALGGVDLYVPQRMYYNDPEQGLYIDLQEGYQTLDGKQAEEFVRFRSGYMQADLGRVNAQKIFLTALMQKVKGSFSLANTATLTKVAEEIFRNLHTDLKVSDILFYAKFLLKVDLADMNMTTIPGNAVYSSGGQSYYVINRAATLKVINEYYNIYETEITDSIFDRNSLFCLNDSKLTPYYYADAETVMDEMYNGQEVNDNSIEIP